MKALVKASACVAVMVMGTAAALAWGSSEKGPQYTLGCGQVQSACTTDYNGNWYGTCLYRWGSYTACLNNSGSCTSVNCNASSFPWQTGSCGPGGGCM